MAACVRPLQVHSARKSLQTQTAAGLRLTH